MFEQLGPGVYLSITKKWVMKGRAPHLTPKNLNPHFHFYWAGLCPEKLANKGRRRVEGEPSEGKKLHYVVPKFSIPPPCKGFFLRLPASLEIPVRLHTFT